MDQPLAPQAATETGGKYECFEHLAEADPLRTALINSTTQLSRVEREILKVSSGSEGSVSPSQRLARILCLCSEAGVERLEGQELCTAFEQIGILAGLDRSLERTAWNPGSPYRQGLREMLGQLGALAEKPGLVPVARIPSVLRTVSYLGVDERDFASIGRLGDRVIEAGARLGHWGISETWFAFQKIGYFSRELYEIFAIVVTAADHQRTAQELSSICSVATKSDYFSEPLVRVVLQDVAKQPRNFDSRALADVSRLCRVFRIWAPATLKPIGDVLTERVSGVRARDLADVAWTFGQLAFVHHEFFAATTQEFLGRLRNIQVPQKHFLPEGRNLAQLAWATAIRHPSIAIEFLQQLPRTIRFSPENNIIDMLQYHQAEVLTGLRATSDYEPLFRGRIKRGEQPPFIPKRPSLELGEALQSLQAKHAEKVRVSRLAIIGGVAFDYLVHVDQKHYALLCTGSEVLFAPDPEHPAESAPAMGKAIVREKLQQLLGFSAILVTEDAWRSQRNPLEFLETLLGLA